MLYLYERFDQPFNHGIFDLEDLLEFADPDQTEDENKNISNRYVNGPIISKGSNQFIISYQQGNSLNFKQRVYQLPDKVSVTLINDFTNQVTMAQFIND